MSKELFVPFDRHGNMLDYSYWGISEEEKELCKKHGRFDRLYPNGELAEMFIPNFVFEDTLIFTRFSRGRSSVKAHFESKYTELKYEMFISDFQNVLKQNRIGNCHVTGRFTFVKKGQNYGIVLLKNENR